MDYLWHWLSNAYMNKNLSPRDHLEDILSSGYLLARNLRNSSEKGFMCKRDPVDDHNFVFLTPNRYLIERAIVHMIRPRIQRGDKIAQVFNPDARVALVFEADRLRHLPGVFLRSIDILADKHSSITLPFEDQDLLSCNEILVRDRLDLKYLYTVFYMGWFYKPGGRHGSRYTGRSTSDLSWDNLLG